MALVSFMYLFVDGSSRLFKVSMCNSVDKFRCASNHAELLIEEAAGIGSFEFI